MVLSIGDVAIIFDKNSFRHARKRARRDRAKMPRTAFARRWQATQEPDGRSFTYPFPLSTNAVSLAILQRKSLSYGGMGETAKALWMRPLSLPLRGRGTAVGGG